MGDVGDPRLATAEERITEFIAAKIAVRDSRTQTADTRSVLRRSAVVFRLATSRVCRAKVTETIRILHRHLQAHVHRQATTKRDKTLALFWMTEMQ